MSAVNNHNSGAMRVLANHYLNTQLFSFMGVDDLERLKLASKKIPQEPIEKIIRGRLIQTFAKNKYSVVTRYGKDALNGIAVRNFPAPIRPPYTNLPGHHMVGFEQLAPGHFSVYHFERYEFFLEPRCSCLPNWVARIHSRIDSLPEIDKLDNDFRWGLVDRFRGTEEPVHPCCADPLNNRGIFNSFKRACGPVIYSCCLCCCYLPNQRVTKNWEQIVEENTPGYVKPGYQVLAKPKLLENITSFLTPAETARVKQVSKVVGSGVQGPKRQEMN